MFPIYKDGKERFFVTVKNRNILKRKLEFSPGLRLRTLFLKV